MTLVWTLEVDYERGTAGLRWPRGQYTSTGDARHTVEEMLAWVRQEVVVAVRETAPKENA